jgi:hypothetical protein
MRHPRVVHDYRRRLIMATKQELDDAEIATITVTQARELEVENEALSLAIDQAQAKVFNGDVKKALVIIEITTD